MTQLPSTARLPILALSLGLVAWSEQETPPSPRRDGGALRLEDHLARARIRSPLADLEPARNLAALEDPAVDLLLDEGFEEFDWEFQEWNRIQGSDLVEEARGRVLRLAGLTGPPSYGWVLPVRTDAFYRFERAVRVEGEPFADFAVVESLLEPETVRIDASTLFLAGRGVALKLHSLPAPDPERPEWQTADTTFYPTPRTRSLVVVLRLRAGGAPGPLAAMSFDDLRLEEVLPTKRERMRLLKGASPAPGADPLLGMHKAGLLLPLPSPDRGRPGEPAEGNYAWRGALYAPPTTEIAFDLAFPAGARLRLATGLARETPLGAAARFQVEVRPSGGGEPVRLLDAVRTARMAEWSWEDVDLDLSAVAGDAGTLVLRTLAEKGDPHPLWGNPWVEAGDASDPLVILIAVDTLRADRLGAYGYERPTTPALDRLAAEGVRFDQARSNCNWTCPSFASIFTGLVPSRHGVTSYGPATPLPEELVTLAEHFRARGWATRSIAYKVPLFDGNYEQGFDQAFNVPRDVIRGEENLARALEWLETHRGGPTFLFLHFNDPHQPFVQPEPFDRAFGKSPEDLGLQLPIGVPGSGQEELQRLFADLYDGAVSYVDSCIGRFLDALRERGLYEDAAIGFVADHGEQLWERGRFGHGGDELFDEVVRVPLIVKPPAGTFETGRVVSADVSGFDVMPTLLELGGIRPPEDLDARSLVPLLSGERERLDRVVVTETSQRGLALVDDGYKLVLEPDGTTSGVFHLASDPAERRDLAREQPAERARLESLAIAYLLEHRPGNYLLLASGEEPARVLLSTRAVRPLVGPVSLQAESNGRVASLAPGTWALLELEGEGAEKVALAGLERKTAETGFDAWVAGALPTLSGPGLWRLRGPERRVRPAPEDGPVEVDVELLEALRRLGYAE